MTVFKIFSGKNPRKSVRKARVAYVKHRQSGISVRSKKAHTRAQDAMVYSGDFGITLRNFQREFLSEEIKRYHNIKVIID